MGKEKGMAFIKDPFLARDNVQMFFVGVHGQRIGLFLTLITLNNFYYTSIIQSLIPEDKYSSCAKGIIVVFNLFSSAVF